MSALDVMPPKRSPMDDPAHSTCIANLLAAGCVILSPDEVRGIRDEALEDAAICAANLPWFTEISPAHIRSREPKEYATAIRSLKGDSDVA